MDLREQKYVCTLAECKSLTRAAERLYISQPALSVYISNLEKSLGIPLFDRSGKRFTLTYAGEQYVAKARQMLLLEREFNEELERIVAERLGRIRLGVSQRRGSHFIPPVLAEYESQHPDVDVVLREGNLTDMNDMLRNGELDLVVMNREDIAAELAVQPLFQEEFLAVAPVCHGVNELSEYVAGSRYRKLNPESLNGQTLILHTAWQSSRHLEDAILKKYQITPARIRVVRSIETAVQMAAEGMGITFAREGYTVHFHYRKPVNYYLLNIDEHQSEVAVAYRKGKPLPAYMQDMIDLLKKHGQPYLLGRF